MAIPAHSQHKEAAPRFLVFIHRQESQRVLLEQGNLLPPTPRVLTGWLFTSAVQQQRRLPSGYPVLLDIATKHSRMLPQLADFEGLTRPINPIFRDMLNNRISVPEAVEKARAAATATLK